MDCLTINQSPFFSTKGVLCSHSRLIPLDPFIIWVPCFVPELHFSSSWALCSFLALLKIHIKYFCTAQIKSVFRTKTWKNRLWLVLSNKGPWHSPAICLFYSSELLGIRVGWWGFFIPWFTSSPSKLFSVLCLISGFSGQMRKPVKKNPQGTDQRGNDAGEATGSMQPSCMAWARTRGFVTCRVIDWDPPFMQTHSKPQAKKLKPFWKQAERWGKRKGSLPEQLSRVWLAVCNQKCVLYFPSGETSWEMFFFIS